MASREFPAYPVVGAGVIVLKGDLVLLARRGSPPAQDQWSIPGGVVELGETLPEAALRELKEECDVEVELGPVVEVVDRIVDAPDGGTQYHYVIVDFLARWVTGEPVAATDVAEVRWVPVDQLAGLDLTVGLPEVIEYAAELNRRLARFPEPHRIAQQSVRGGNYLCGGRVPGAGGQGC